MDMTARASCASSFSSHCACVAKPGRNAARDDFENSADRIARAQHVIDFRLHARFRRRGSTQRSGDSRFSQTATISSHVAARSSRTWPTAIVWLSIVGAEFAQQQLRQRAGSHARRRLARRGALEHVARIVEIELLCAGQVGVAGPRRGQPALRVLGAFAILDRQRLLPIFPVAVFDAQRDRRADRFPVAHAREEFRLILLDSLASAAAISQLAAVQLAPDEIQVHRHARRQPGNPGDERLPVRLSGGNESQHVQ